MQGIISEERIKQIVHETLLEYIDEYRKANVKGVKGVFNFNDVNVHVFNDHYPPHFHVTKGDNLEYNLKFRIDNGEFIGDESNPIERINVTARQWDTLINYFMINYDGFCTLNQSSKKFSVTSLSGMEPFQFDELCFKYI